MAKLIRNSPRLICLIGKTCTGKTTLAIKLVSLGYKHLELDNIVVEKIVNGFKMTDPGQAFSVYKGTAPDEWQKAFEKEVTDILLNYLKQSRVVVEAAIADPKVLERILEKIEGFEIVFLHPFNKDEYLTRIKQRLVEDIQSGKVSFAIWKYMTTKILQDYEKYGISGKKINKVIKKYGEESIRESEKRLIKFTTKFPNLVLTFFD